MRPLSIPLTPGLPDAGVTGQWLGRDRHGAVYTLRWMPEKQCFGALGWSATHRKQPWPHLVLLQGKQQGFIVGHVEGPAIELAPREGFLAAALQDLARDDRPMAALVVDPAWQHEVTTVRGRLPPPPPPDRMVERDPPFAAWFWTVAMLFGLPALALALVVLAVNAPRCEAKPTTGAASLITCRSAE
jgi:hypothetical protein